MRDNKSSRINSGKKGSSGNFKGRSRFGGDNRRGFQSDYFGRSTAEMHSAVCSDCKKQCEVPFKPTEGKPVYCKECYNKHRPKRF